MNGIGLIITERQEQISKHGRTIAHDVQYNGGFQLSQAASFLCSDDWGCLTVEDIVDDHCPDGWDEAIFQKMLEKPYKERLVIAGALIAAEIDRLQATESEVSNG